MLGVQFVKGELGLRSQGITWNKCDNFQGAFTIPNTRTSQVEMVLDSIGDKGVDLNIASS